MRIDYKKPSEAKYISEIDRKYLPQNPNAVTKASAAYFNYLWKYAHDREMEELEREERKRQEEQEKQQQLEQKTKSLKEEEANKQSLSYIR